MNQLCCLVALIFGSVKSEEIIQFPISKNHGRIVNGEAAETNQFPYQVSLHMLEPMEGYCGGSIILPTFILTAAHCVNDFSKFEIGYGSNQRDSPNKIVSFIKHVHPGYNVDTLENDIALIELTNALPVDNLSIKTILLPRTSQQVEDYDNKIAIISGFGRTSDDPNGPVSPVLNFVLLRMIPKDVCISYFNDAPESAICGKGDLDPNQNACQGDSGGPLVMTIGGSLTQIGVASFSGKVCSAGEPTGYSNVVQYLEWIKSMTNIELRA